MRIKNTSESDSRIPLECQNVFWALFVTALVTSLRGSLFSCILQSAEHIIYKCRFWTNRVCLRLTGRPEGDILVFL